jgi:glycerol-3-phosphate dehydrogenase
MKRKLENLTAQKFDILVLGGGIYGAITAWDAALRGLSVALIERGDFGGATSQNSLKIIHGGLRYLQDGNLQRVRLMARERSVWMKMAPHLVHPLPCLMPLGEKITRSRLALGAALTVNDLISYDRNRGASPDKTIQHGKIISRQECTRLIPGADLNSANGAARWNDGLIYNPERLLLEFILSAADSGAEVANYVEAVRLLNEGSRVTGVQARDVLTGHLMDIHAGVVINCIGAWIPQLLSSLKTPQPVKQAFSLSVALNLIVDQIWPDCAVGLSTRPGGKKRSQILFFVPWRNKTFIGTWHIPWPHPADDFKVNQEDVQNFIHEINSAHPRLNLTIQDVQHVNWGFLPAKQTEQQSSQVKLVRDSQIIDHMSAQGVAGLISVVGVKYTTARAVAEKAVDLAMTNSGKKSVHSRTQSTPVKGGHVERFQDFLTQAKTERRANVDDEIFEHLVYTYGSQYGSLVDDILQQPASGTRIDPTLPVTEAEVVHAARHEMAIKLIDVIQRRTEIGAAGLPSMDVLKTTAEKMGAELEWDQARQEREIEDVLRAYPIQPGERMMA